MIPTYDALSSADKEYGQEKYNSEAAGNAHFRADQIEQRGRPEQTYTLPLSTAGH